ncbi:hypothetical protein PIB30_086382 [Stylosanthes scabra]|uniref:Uncharacterized protein n=1 Tax=Stylosanthes scabra TaxID=79078 RepID=A0ABU6VSY2_9FABA|nr:hypothetical protein [Stylosanthes scabra]
MVTVSSGVNFGGRGRTSSTMVHVLSAASSELQRSSPATTRVRSTVAAAPQRRGSVCLLRRASGDPSQQQQRPHWRWLPLLNGNQTVATGVTTNSGNGGGGSFDDRSNFSTPPSRPFSFPLFCLPRWIPLPCSRLQRRWRHPAPSGSSSSPLPLELIPYFSFFLRVHPMARKSKAVKEQKDDTDVKYDKSHRTRCSPSEVAKVYITLLDKKKELVREMRFGDLVENVFNFNFSNLIMPKVVESFLIPTSSIKTNVEKISINAAKIGPFQKEVLGSIEGHGDRHATGFIREHYLFQESLHSLHPKGPVVSEQLKASLTGNSADGMSTSMNWVRHVYSFLLNGIQEMRKKNLKCVDGCVCALFIIYFYDTHFREESEKAEAQPLWLAYWKDDTLYKRIKVEFEDPGGSGESS